MVRKVRVCELCAKLGCRRRPGTLSLVQAFLRPSVMRDNRGTSVLVCLFCHFLNIGSGRIGSILLARLFNCK